jgi:hypothetical protein
MPAGAVGFDLTPAPRPPRTTAKVTCRRSLVEVLDRLGRELRGDLDARGPPGVHRLRRARARPGDRRAKLVRATPRGREVYAIARDVVAEVERDWTRRLGKPKMRQLRRLLEELNACL